jgi:hypothetical protein
MTDLEAYDAYVIALLPRVEGSESLYLADEEAHQERTRVIASIANHLVDARRNFINRNAPTRNV